MAYGYWGNSYWGSPPSEGGDISITPAEIAQAVWQHSTRVLTAGTNIDLSALATATDLATVDTVVDAIKAKTDNLPASPAAVGSAMTLTAAYDKAKDDVLTPLGVVDGVVDAVKAKTDLIPAAPAVADEYDAALAAIQADLDNPDQYKADVSGLATAAALTTVDNEVGVIDGIVDAIKAKTDNLPADPADDSDIDAQLAAIKAETALIVEDTGTTIPATLADLALEATLTAIKGAGWTDQTLAALMTAIEAVSGGSGATAQEVWEYTTRVLTAGTNIDLSGLAPAGEYDAELTAIQADLDNPAQYKADVSSLATTAHVQEVEDKIDVIDNVADAIKVKTDQLTFTVAGSVDATATADISGIAGDVWSHANRTLTNQGTSVTSPAEGDPLEIYRDTTVYITLTGIGATTGYTKIWFTVKEDLEDADTDAILQIDTTDKLKYIDGEAGTSTDGLLVIDSEEETADITLLQASARLLPVYTAYPAFWDLKMLNDGVVSLLSTGEIYIYSTPTRSIS